MGYILNGYTREGIFVEGLWVSDKKLEGEPEVSEVGCTSAPLESMAYHFGSYCKAYNEDYVLCTNESSDPQHCLKEGRKVTRCAIDLYDVSH
jgi:NADH dehydrogenase (ubiquinone) 1 alpha subcomplex subunit 8